MTEEEDAKRSKDIEEVRQSEQKPAAKLAEAERLRERRKLTKDLIRCKNVRNLRAFGEALRRAGIRESSPEWNAAWAFYYDRL